MAIQEGPDQIGQKGISKSWPFEEGLTAGTTRQVNDPYLRPEEDSLVLRRI